MILQLEPPLPFKTTKGDGWAHFMIDYGMEHDILWVVFMDETGECWSIRNPDVRLDPNWSINARRGPDEPDESTVN